MSRRSSLAKNKDADNSYAQYDSPYKKQSFPKISNSSITSSDKRQQDDVLSASGRKMYSIRQRKQKQVERPKVLRG